ncbi:LamG domain-containing protein [Streptomyces noursei]|nr:LamG domain-containing protein [Streptomyces noursei]
MTADLSAVFEAASDAQQMILECWIKTTTVSRAILGLYSTGLDYQVALTLSASGELVVEYTDSGGTLTTHNTADVVNDGQWHHIVLDMANTNKAVYLDGVLGAITLTVPPDMHGLRHLHVGGYRGNRLFAGQIAHVAVTHCPTQTTSTMITEFVETRYEAGTAAFAGEDADVRVTRLARYGA